MSSEIAKRELDELGILRRQCEIAVASGFLPPALKDPNKAMMIAMKARELGVQPLLGLSHINIIGGKPVISAELMRAMIFSHVPTAEMVFTERTNEKVTVKARRSKDQEWSFFTFTIEDAKQAGLMRNQVWSKYPRSMLTARATSEMARSMFADALSGCTYTPEEMGAVIDENEEVLQLPAEGMNDSD